MKITQLLNSKLLKTFAFVAILFSYSACTSDDDTAHEEPITEIDPPIVIDCQYFNNHPNAILEDNPYAPVDYLVICNGTSIPDDVTIEPGVTIAFETDASFWVREEGSLKAVGTTSQPITFTGVDKAMGSWAGIYFGSNDSKNEIKYALIEYGGGSASAWSSSEKGGVVIGANSSLKFSNNTVQHCKAWGVNLYYNANETLTSIDNNTFIKNEIPVRISSPMVDVLKGNNDYMENQVNKIEIKTDYPIEGNKTLRKATVPYWVKDYNNAGFRVGNGKLTIEPGTKIEMDNNTWFSVGANGALKIVGTSAEKISITGVAQVPGGWGNIRFSESTSSENQIQHAIIKHAGAGAHSSSNIHVRGAVYIGYDSTLAMSDILFEDIQSCVLFSDQFGIDNVNIGSGITSNNTNTIGLDDCLL